jgi:hypothetical protein
VQNRLSYRLGISLESIKAFTSWDHVLQSMDGGLFTKASVLARLNQMEAQMKEERKSGGMPLTEVFLRAIGRSGVHNVS